MSSYQKSFIVYVAHLATTYAAFPSIQATVDGVPTTLYVHTPSWSEANVTGDSLSFRFNSRMYLSKSPEIDTANYFTPDLLGGFLTYDIDLSKVGCGCITALYGINMPAVDNTSDPFKYCDANQVGGHWCPEFDIMEANKYAYRGTAHKCETPDASGIFPSCDRSGQCSVDVLTNDAEFDYGPGS